MQFPEDYVDPGILTIVKGEEAYDFDTNTGKIEFYTKFNSYPDNLNKNDFLEDAYPVKEKDLTESDKKIILDFFKDKLNYGGKVYPNNEFAKGGQFDKEDIKRVFNSLENYVGRLRVQEEGPEQIEASIRDWGYWESDYDDGRDEDDYEDDDYEILSNSSVKRLNEIIEKIKKDYPEVKITWESSEKNWIDFSIEEDRGLKNEKKITALRKKWES